MSKLSYEAPQVIQAWRDAYCHANGRPAPAVSYERGWFVMRDPYTVRYRRSQMEDFTARLRGRALYPEGRRER
jgi:hypothetical protein